MSTYPPGSQSKCHGHDRFEIFARLLIIAYASVWNGIVLGLVFWYENAWWKYRVLDFKSHTGSDPPHCIARKQRHIARETLKSSYLKRTWPNVRSSVQKMFAWVRFRYSIVQSTLLSLHLIWFSSYENIMFWNIPYYTTSITSCFNRA